MRTLTTGEWLVCLFVGVVLEIAGASWEMASAVAVVLGLSAAAHE